MKLWQSLAAGIITAGGLAAVIGQAAHEKHNLVQNLDTRRQELHAEYEGIPLEGNAVRTIKVDGDHINSFNAMFKHCIGKGGYGAGWEDYQSALEKENPGLDLNAKVHAGDRYKAPVGNRADQYCGKDIVQ